MSRFARITLLLAGVGLVLACLLLLLRPSFKPVPPPPPKPPTLHLTRIGFADLPGWDKTDLTASLASFRRGCAALTARDPKTPMGGKGYGGTAGDWLAACQQSGYDARKFFESTFTPWRLSGDGKTSGLFTGYYEPRINGSRTRQGAFQTPVYGLPADLISVNLALFNPHFEGEHVSGKLDGQKLVPYAARREIDAKGLAAAKILFWCDDPVALFFLQIQGSGRVHFADGSSERVTFAGTNGRPYTAIGRVLIANGALKREDVSLDSIRAWLKANPAKASSVMEADQSFVFFEEKPLGDETLGASGTLGVPLTPNASLAIDPRLNVLGAPYYVDSPPVQGLLVGQDTGGAIRGAVRGDVYFGFGDDAAAKAGTMKATGSLYVLLPKTLTPSADFP